MPVANADRFKEFAKKIDKLNKQWAKQRKVEGGTDRIRIGSSLPDAELISTGNPAMDWGLGGGIPEGTIIELYGAPGCGKTTAMCYVMAQVQRRGKLVLYYHTEESHKPSKAWKLAGVDENAVVYIDARRSGEDGINVIRDLLLDDNGLPNDLVGMIVIDSISALAPEAEMNSVDNNGMEGVTVGRQAALTSKMFRIVCGSGWLHEGCIVGLVNQERAQIGQTPLPNVTSGGKSIPYYAKIRIQLKAPKDGYILDEQKQVIGHTVEYYVSKNNTGSSAPFRRGSWKVIYDKGIDYLGPMIDEAMTYGIIQEVAKARFIVRWIESGVVKSSDKFHGRAAVVDFIETSGAKVQEGLQEAISKVRTYASNFDVRFVDGFAYIAGQEVDILDKVVATEVVSNIISSADTEQAEVEDISSSSIDYDRPMVPASMRGDD